MKRIVLLMVTILLVSSGFAFAAVPCKINYQGRLIENNVPVDRTKTMVFSIYDSAVGPTLLWTSGNVSVEVHNGLFRYVIGSGVTDLSGIPWTAGQALYLEVQVGTDILTPREELSAYPYAINSHLLEGATKEYFLNTSGETQKKDGGLNIMGNVGIGTTSPESGQAIHILRTKANTDGRVKIEGTGNVNAAGLTLKNHDNSKLWDITVRADSNDDLWFSSFDGSNISTAMVIKQTSGNVDIIKGGLEPDFDSGWVVVNTPATNTVYTLQHNMNALPTRYQIWFSPTNPPTWIYPMGHGISPGYNAGVTGGVWDEPHSIRFNTTKIEYTLVGGQAVGRYWDNGWTLWTSGYMRFVLWK